ncbi:TPA: DUF5052 domain-containing protein [Clostridioides difficile]
MKRFLLIGVLGTMLIGMSGCTEVQENSKDEINKPTTVSLYSTNGEVLKKYSDKDMRINYSDEGNVILYLNEKKVIMCNVPVIIEKN